MKDEEIVAISELLKLALMVYMNYAKQAGLTAEQVEAAFKDAKARMLIKDPSNLPG